MDVEAARRVVQQLRQAIGVRRAVVRGEARRLRLVLEDLRRTGEPLFRAADRALVPLAQRMEAWAGPADDGDAHPLAVAALAAFANAERGPWTVDRIIDEGRGWGAQLHDGRREAEKVLAQLDVAYPIAKDRVLEDGTTPEAQELLAGIRRFRRELRDLAAPFDTAALRREISARA